MNQTNPYSSYGSREAGKNGKLKSFLIVGGVAFLLGAALVGWLAVKSGMEIPGLDQWTSSGADEADTGTETLVSPSPTPRQAATAQQTAVAVEQATEAVEKVAQQQGGLDQRVAGLEQRINRLDLQAEAAAGNAARAEGLLIAFAARRRLERGDQLGYIENQLRLRFGEAEPRAVETVIEAAKKPVTLDQLLARLEGLAPQLGTQSISEGGMDWFKRELSQLFVVRREDSPSPAPEMRLARARLFLETDRPAAAIAEIRNMPGAQLAKQWLADAETYAAARDALDRLESAAVLEPRKLRDGSGNAVQQLSPGQESAL